MSGGAGYLAAAYALVGSVLLGYALSVERRIRRARRARREDSSQG